MVIAPYDKEMFHEAFPFISPQKLSQPTGQIDILIGLDNAHLMPKEVGRVGGLLLYKSQLGCSPPMCGGQCLI